MTGRYLINTRADSIRHERRFDAAWRRFVEICRSLHRDGLDYSVRLNLADARPHVLITASGKAKPRRQAGAHRLPLPPPIAPQRCRERALEVEWFLPEFLRAELEYWRELELLSGQRARLKPGITDETAYLDDEVAA